MAFAIILYSKVERYMRKTLPETELLEFPIY